MQHEENTETNVEDTISLDNPILCDLIQQENTRYVVGIIFLHAI